MITNTNKLDKSQVKKLLEYNNIQIVKDHGTYYTITCPNCKEPEAFIVYTGEMRWIKCNRESNCYEDDKPAYNKKLWNFIADSQGVDENDSSAIVQYIRQTLEKPDLEIKPVELKESVSVELTQEDLKFLQQCDEIFKQAILQDNETAKFVRAYLQEERGYSQKIIQKFKIGLLPSTKDLMAVLTENYSYNEEQAKYHIDKLLGVTKYNDNSEHEFTKNNITIAWKEDKGEVQGFSLRKPTSKKVANKYMSSKGLRKSKLLFNLNSYIPEQNKKLVIVEGQFDVLAATHIATKEVQEKYHFVASGGKSVSVEQASLLQKQGVKEVILLIDNDAAGENYTNSVKNLAQQGIITFIAKLPENSQFKDIDELLKNNPQENNFMEILENAKPEESTIDESDIEFNIKKNEVITELENTFLAGAEIDTYELQKVKIQEDTEHIKQQLQEAINKKDISEIIEKSNKYNKKIYEDGVYDQPYSTSDYKNDMIKDIIGYKTGFSSLDNLVAIEPGTLTLIAGRPSHGKTTMMLNMYRNMIKADEDKSFLFYSYEEHRWDIVNKIVISLAKIEYLTNEMFADIKEDNEINGMEENILIPELLPEQTYWQAIKHEINKYWKNGEPKRHTPITLAISKVTKWIDEGRLCVMGKKSSVEKLSFGLIDKAVEYMNSNKYRPLGAAYIDYTQKLNTEANRPNRQQELQVICETLLNTTLNKRFHAPLILGSQVNRMVYSLATLTADKLREAGDQEQDANLILGIWDDKQAQEEKLLILLEDYEKKKLKFKAENKEKELAECEDAIANIEEDRENDDGSREEKTIKILKSRNGSTGQVELNAHSSEFLLQDKVKQESIKVENLINKDFQ